MILSGNLTEILYASISQHDADKVIDCLSNGVDPNSENAKGDSCLAAAIQHFDSDNPETVSILDALLNAGGNPLLQYFNTDCNNNLFEFALREECSFPCFKMLFVDVLPGLKAA